MVRYGSYLLWVTVYTGMSAVCKNLTHSIPVQNPSQVGPISTSLYVPSLSCIYPCAVVHTSAQLHGPHSVICTPLSCMHLHMYSLTPTGPCLFPLIFVCAGLAWPLVCCCISYYTPVLALTCTCWLLFIIVMWVAIHLCSCSHTPAGPHLLSLLLSHSCQPLFPPAFLCAGLAHPQSALVHLHIHPPAINHTCCCHYYCHIHSQYPLNGLSCLPYI